MRITPIEKEDKTGRIITLRNAEISDAENLITYMKITSFETPFLLREPDEFHLTSEQEECFIQNTIDNPRELMLLATVKYDTFCRQRTGIRAGGTGSSRK